MQNLVDIKIYCFIIIYLVRVLLCVKLISYNIASLFIFRKILKVSPFGPPYRFGILPPQINATDTYENVWLFYPNK